MTWTISSEALTRIYLHCAKYPASTVLGILVASESAPETIKLAFPVLHRWQTLSFLTDLALGFVETYCERNNAVMRGIYIAHEDIRNVALNESLTGLLNAIHSKFANPIAIVVRFFM